MRRAVVLALLLVSTGLAGEYNKTLSVGSKAPEWVDLPGTDGKNHSLAEHKDKPVVVVVFICNSCAVAVGYEDRLIAFQKKHADKVAVVAINVNTIEADRMPKMQERAKEKGFNFQYLYDESQKLGRDYGAIYTPEFFVLDKDRKIAYLGAMDDKSPPGQPTKLHLEDAVEATLRGEKATVGETLARGCLIRYPKKR